MHLLRNAMWVVVLGLGAGTPMAAAAPEGPGTAPTTNPASPLTPAQAAASFELEPGLAVQLVAAEPLVASPCAVAWDERGRMYVAENRGYPVGGPGGTPVGSVALLEDTDGDGAADKRTDFATGLSFPNGVLPWRGGVIVTDAPDVLYLKDTDGDGKADVREVLLTGFETAKTTQLRVNDPTLGPDGWVYLAGGLSRGKVRSPKHPDRVLDLARTDLKFRPDTGEMEPVDGKGQFGLTFDDAGHRFVCYNRVQVQHAPLPARYLARSPGVTSPGVLNNCPELLRNVMLGLPNDAGARIYPVSANVTTADSHAGTYSAACAVHIARGDRIPLEYVGKAWSCDPTGNLVRYDELVPAGGSFHAKRVRDNVEAFRSRDDWFRPVFLADGPDGALYVVDMYRKVIEHPEYLPEEVRKTADFESGKDMGRIWRIVRSTAKPDAYAGWAEEAVWLFAAETDERLVEALRSDNGWTRDTAFRRITERGVAAAGTPLREALAREVASADAPAATVVCCLNLLANAGEPADAAMRDAMRSALKHRAPEVRENAVRLAEPRLADPGQGDSRPLADAVLALADDEHVHVRYAVALAVGEIVTGLGEPRLDPRVADARRRALRALGNAAARGDADDKWFRAAILSSSSGPGVRVALFRQLTSLPQSATQELPDGVLALVHDLARLYALDAMKADPDGGGVFELLWSATTQHGFDVRAAVLVGTTTGTPAEFREGLLHKGTGLARDTELARTIKEAARIAADASAPAGRRARAVDVLAVAGDEASEAALLALVAPEQPTDLAVAAVRALAQPHRAEAAVPKLLEADRWSRYSPAVRSTLLLTLTGRPETAPALVAAIESGAVPASSLTEPQRKWVLAQGDEPLKARAAKLFAGGGAPEDRRQAFEAAKAALALKPDAAKGKRVFANHCASCHRLDREGYAVGPDLFGIRSQPKESILLHIVVPEQEVPANFAAYDCVTTDGRTLTGIMTAETPASVTLRQVLGIEETIPREQIRSLTASKNSLMPAGLEKAMKPQEMADLLAYLRGEK